MRNPHLKLGDTHKAVKHLIRALRLASGRRLNGAILRISRYKHYTIGIFFSVWFFQNREGLPRTGECDAVTWKALERFL